MLVYLHIKRAGHLVVEVQGFSSCMTVNSPANLNSDEFSAELQQAFSDKKLYHNLPTWLVLIYIKA